MTTPNPTPNTEIIISDEDFDRFWDEAVNDANQRLRERSDRSDPTERHHCQRLSRATGGSRVIVSVSSKQRLRPKINQRNIAHDRLSSHQEESVSSNGARDKPESQNPLATQRAPAPSGGSNILAVKDSVSDRSRDHREQIAASNFDPSQKNSVPHPTMTAPIAANFSALDISSTSRQDGLSGDAYASTCESDFESLPCSINNDSSLSRGQKHQRARRRMSVRFTKSDLQREAAKFVLQLKSFSSDSGVGPDDNMQTSAHPYYLPTTFEAEAYKEMRKHPTGLVLSLNHRNEIDSVMVKDIAPQSIFSHTALHVGHEILAINEHRVKCPQQAAKIMKSIKGTVHLLVSEGRRPPGTKYVRVKHNSKGKEEHEFNRNGVNWLERGLGIQLQTKQGLVQVKHIDSGGLFSTSSIHPGDIFLTLNGSVTRDEAETMKLLFGSSRQGLICALVYSMSDLRVGLVDQLFSDHWEASWSSDYQKVTISRFLPSEQFGLKNSSFVLNFNEDWSCQCSAESSATLVTENLWDVVFKNEVEPLVHNINGAVSFVVEKLREVVQEGL